MAKSGLEIAAEEMMAECADLSEQLRVRALRRLGILDTPPEPVFDDVVELAAQVLGTAGAVLTFIDTDRNYIKASLSGPVGDQEPAEAFCNLTIQTPTELMIIPDAQLDPRVNNKPAVIDKAVRFYAGVPLVTADGQAVGSLCVIDPEPRIMTEEEADLLRKIGRVALTLTVTRPASGEPNL